MMKVRQLLAVLNSSSKTLLFSLMLCLGAISNVSAHLMVAQTGTLNFVDKGAFLVLSLPVSAFAHIDDDGDGKMSLIEFGKHRSKLIAAINKNIKLMENKVARPLEGLMLSPAQSHHAPKAPSEQIVIMGRFALQNRDSSYEVHIGLYGKKLYEQTVTIKAKRQNSPGKYKLVLTPEQKKGQLFPKTS